MKTQFGRTAQIVSVLLLAFTLSSCASYLKRKSCESTNWFEYGEKVALDGRRLTGDQFILECQQADSDIDESALDVGFKSGMQKYCTPDGIYAVGRQGSFFNTDLCSGAGLNQLRLRHNDGVLEYCKKSNGYTAGATGRTYNKICPSALEKDFLPEFNRGRKKYLNVLISQNQNQARELEQQVSRSESELSYKRGLLVGLQARSTNDMTEAARSDWNTRLGRLNSEVSTLSSQVRANKNKIESLKNQNRQLELEIIQLGP